jgi:hypothetical protein
MSSSNEIRSKELESSERGSRLDAMPRLRRRGRPTILSPDAVLERIRQLAGNGGLYRVHRTHGNLYARARRQFGSWAGAVQAAGIDYRRALAAARQRSIETRRRQRRRRALLFR